MFNNSAGKAIDGPYDARFQQMGLERVSRGQLSEQAVFGVNSAIKFNPSLAAVTRPLISLTLVRSLYQVMEVIALLLLMFGLIALHPSIHTLNDGANLVLLSLAIQTVYTILVINHDQSRYTGKDYIPTSSRLRHWTLAFGAVLAAIFLLKTSADFSRLWMLSSYVLGAVLIIAASMFANFRLEILAQKGRIGDRVVVYGAGPRTEYLIKRLFGNTKHGLVVDAVFDTRATRVPPSIRGVPVSNSLDNLIAYIKANKVDVVVLDLPWTAKDRIHEIVTILESVNVDIYLAPTELQILNSEYSLSHLGDVPTLAVYERPIRGLGAIAKMAVDRLVAAVLLLLLSPLLLAVAIAIKLDSPGPLLFRQQRCGINNQPFTIYKFRSMRSDMADAHGNVSTQRDDPRITRIGAFIRRTSIDELPQLLNVLKGDMSLVGPRPHAPGSRAGDKLFDEVVRRYPARHRVLPGITGLAQVRGFRGATDTEDEIINRVTSDLEYIRTWSLLLDVKILFATGLIFLLQKKAY